MQYNKVKLQKKYHEKYQRLSKEETKKSDKMGVKDTKASLKTKKKNQLGIEKNIIKYGKTKVLPK